jgi:hypothetical protein
MQYGPSAAGVRSMRKTPRSRSFRALSAWADALVASKAMRTPSAVTWGTRPSTPCAVVFRPIPAARFRPSEAGSIPTIQTGSIHSLRFAL